MKKYSQKNKKLKKINISKPGLASLSILSLFACGGGGGGGGAANPTPPPPPATPQATLDGFTETSAFVYQSTGALYTGFSFTETSENLTVNGGVGADNIEVGRGNDIVSSGDGNDKITGLSGADVLDGGDGFDILIYGTNSNSSSNQGVNVNLATHTASGGDAQGDQISNFEGVFGSNFADVITGDNNDNFLSGRDGADTIFGGGGNDLIMGGDGADILDGGAGYDILVYGSAGYTIGSTIVYHDHYHQSSSVIVNLETQTATHGGTTDQISSFEGVFGSDGNGILTGSNDGENILRGNLGDDVINGGNNDDRLFGDTTNVFSFDGDDIINGGGGDDSIEGSGGNDTLNGGSGDDFINPGPGIDMIDGGSGDDVFYFHSQFNSFHEDTIDGGDGMDEIYLSVGNTQGALTFDFSMLNATNIESISLDSFNEMNLINVNVQDVLDVTDAGNLLYIYGGTEDTVSASGQGWVQGADILNPHGLTMNSYTSGGATLLIDEDIVQVIS